MVRVGWGWVVGGEGVLAWELLEGGERGRGGKGEGGGREWGVVDVGGEAWVWEGEGRMWGKEREVVVVGRGMKVVVCMGILAHTDGENRLLFKHYV